MGPYSLPRWKEFACVFCSQLNIVAWRVQLLYADTVLPISGDHLTFCPLSTREAQGKSLKSAQVIYGPI